MSREDKISQLFINNQHKLDEAPSADLWSRIDTKLNEGVISHSEAPEVKAKKLYPIFKRYIPYLAAAVVLILLVVSIPYFNKEDKSKSGVIAENGTDPKETVTIQGEESLPTSESEKDSEYETKDRIQKEKMLETAKKTAGENRKVEKIIEEFGLDRIEINEKSEDLIVLSVEPSVEEEKSFIAKPKAENSELFGNNRNANSSNIVNRSEYQNDGRAYADPPAIKQSKAIDNQIVAANSMSKQSANVPIMKNKALKRDNSQRLDGQMQIFEWLLGQWIDKEEEGGRATENWRKVNGSSIECVGTKVNGKNKIFEEKLIIYFDKDQNHVFLKMPIDDYKKSLRYMMISHNLDRIVFEQNDEQDLPQKVIIQRNLNGFSVIINADTKPLNPAQQAYFEHRNRVSNSKVLRILTVDEK